MTNAELKTNLEALAVKHTFTVERYGRSYTAVPSVRSVDRKQGRDGFSISVPVNAFITKKKAIAIIFAIRKELAQMNASADTLRALKLDIPGLWHMGHFSPDCVASRHYASAS